MGFPMADGPGPIRAYRRKQEKEYLLYCLIKPYEVISMGILGGGNIVHTTQSSGWKRVEECFYC